MYCFTQYLFVLCILYLEYCVQLNFNWNLTFIQNVAKKQNCK